MVNGDQKKNPLEMHGCFEKKTVAKGDYIRDFSVGFYVGGQKDQSWDKFCEQFNL